MSARSTKLSEDPRSPLADPSARLAAVVLDSAIPAIPHLLLMPVGALLRSAALIHAAMWLGWLAMAVCFVIDIVLLARCGQSIGKRIVGLRIVRTDGTRCSLARLFWLRTVLPTVLGFVPILGWLVGLADALMIFASDRRTLHDHIADTIVIDLRAELKTPELSEVFA